MASLWILSPSLSTAKREDSAIPSEYKQTESNTKMMKIQSLLNPSGGDDPGSNGAAPEGMTPSSMSIHDPQSSATVSPIPPTSNTPSTLSSAKRPKHTKDAAKLTPGKPKTATNYPAYECGEESISLSKAETAELNHQHRRFVIKPSKGAQGDRIGDFTNHIPYSSNKKSFAKTGRDGFYVFSYKFRVPSDEDGKNESKDEYEVMWDYDIGLVRITPFFKALKYSKTTPAKALNTNDGLKELAHSITGGALTAQGYWTPYQCARALCLTFCYQIRWALTPVFGQSFVRECLPPTHRDFGKFKISPEVIRNAQLESAGWGTPVTEDVTEAKEIPRSVPEDQGLVAGGKALRPRPAKTTKTVFKDGSPFDDDKEDVGDADFKDDGDDDDGVQSPGLSPKTSKTTATKGWTPINASPSNATTPHGLGMDSLLTQSRYAPWRPARPEDSDGSTPRAIRVPKGGGAPKRRRDDNYQEGETHSGSDAASESDDIEIELPRKRVRRSSTEKHEEDDEGWKIPPANRNGGGLRAKKFTAEDARAAQILLSLHVRDAELATAHRGKFREAGKK